MKTPARVLRVGALLAATVCLTAFTISSAFAQGADGQAPPQNPFLPPIAHQTYAPNRDYDLQHVAVTLNVDYPHRTFTGEVTNTLAPLREAGLTELPFHCGEKLVITGVTIEGQSAPYRREGELLIVTAPRRIKQGEKVAVTIDYHSVPNTQGTGFGSGDGGLHWISPTAAQPDRVGFWTQGETSGNRLWVPTWDYPNDFATSESTVTVPADWTVIGNGVKVSDKVDKDKGTRTVHWKMDLPHATYLLSVAAGPLDMKKARWEGVDLLYVVPKGRANTIDFSFGNTPDMLSFYSQVTGVKYVWPKYAQDAMYDFSGGMENVSATTLGQNSLQDPRGNEMSVVSLTSHELAHQWFGDTVTCADWGQIWLNESFATFFQMMYFEHRYGKNEYDREVASNIRQYLAEARRYERPVVTNMYPNPDALFDRTAYPKGGAILHTLRRQIGDAALFAGLHQYLTTHLHTPVTTQDLAEAITKSSGINMQPFFDQWLYKPGHPVLAWSWSYDADKKNVLVTVKQTQDLSNGTPIYDLPMTIAFLSASGQIERVKAEMKTADTTFVLPAAVKPDAVLLDPDHDFLRDIPKLPWGPTELPVILQFAPNGIDRTNALTHYLTDTTPTDDQIALAAKVVAADTGPDIIFARITPLINLKKESLRPLFRGLLTVSDQRRRVEAIQGLGGLSKTPEDEKTLQAIAADKTQPNSVVRAADAVLGDWNPSGNLTLLRNAAAPDSPDMIRGTALGILAKTDPEGTRPLLLKYAEAKNDEGLRASAFRAMGALDAADAASRAVLLAVFSESATRSRAVTGAALAALEQRKDRDAIPALQNLADAATGNGKRAYLDAIRAIESDRDADASVGSADQ